MMDGLELTDDQRRALDAMRSGRNILLTGDAGTGKSFVLDAYLEEAERQGRNVIAMAPTGVAALNLRNGSTIHRTLGLKAEFQDPVSKPKVPKVLKSAEVIVIDEFSMCRIDLFERVATMISTAQEKSGPKQLIVAGDPFQLPPVVTARDRAALENRFGCAGGYCFNSKLWKSFDFRPQILREVVRQKDDAELSGMLALAREGKTECVPFFNEHALGSPEDAPSEAIWLCPRNASAAEINARRLSELKAKEHVFQSDSCGDVLPADKATDDRLVLKIGARVMAVANDSDLRYANGSLGTVLAINPDADKPVTVAFDDGTVASIGYHEWDVIKSVVSEETKEGTKGEPATRVKSEVVGKFCQIPLRLAWAMTIHKAQGKSFDDVCVDTRVFERGQLYVALSRATTFDGLHVFPAITNNRLISDETAMDFYSSIVDKSELRYEDTSLRTIFEKSVQGGTTLTVPTELRDEVIRVIEAAGIGIENLDQIRKLGE